MKKLFKTVAALLFAAGLFALLPSMEAKAAEEMNIVYANVPTDWENPCVWAWDADGNGAFEAWPGQTMTADENNDGWYYLYVPATMSNVIINANEGSVQTKDFSTNGVNAWFTVTSADEAEVSNDQLTEGDIPEYVPTFKVYAKVAESWVEPGLWAWSAPDGTNLYVNWPGEAMKANTDGFYSMEVPTWVNSIIVNANEGTVQTADISVEPNDLWLVVAEDGSFELFNEKPAASAEDMITVHAQAPSDWLLPCLWAWSAPDGTNVFANWPGEELALDGDWYVMDVPNWVNSVIVNGNLGAVQTADISVEAGKDIWLVVKSADEYELFYEEPSLDTEAAETASEEAEVTETFTETAVEKEGLSTGVIVAIVAGALVVIGGVLFVVLKKKRS